MAAVMVSVMGLAACSGGGPATTEAAPPPTGATSPATTAAASSTVASTTVPATTTPAPEPTTQATVPTAEELQPLLEAWIAEVHTFGASLAVADAGGGRVAVAAGLDDRDPAVPMTVDRQFHIASITKTFVTAAVLQLADEGRLSLDDPVATWVPELPDGDRITIRMLLGHTSGLGDLTRDRPADYQSVVLADLTRVYSPAEALALSSALPPSGMPGERFDYANSNFLVLGMVVSAITGQPFEETIDARFVTPLGLRDTTAELPSGFGTAEAHGWFSLDPAVGDPADGTFDPSVPRDLDIADFPRSAVLTAFGSAAQMRSTLDDLLTWGAALFGGEVLGDSTSLLWDGGPTDPAVSGYGLGTIVSCPCPDGGQPDLVGHDGHLVGTRTLLVHSASTGLTIAIHANSAEVSMADLLALARSAITSATAA